MFRLLVRFLAVELALALPAAASTLAVPAEYPSIQQAIDSAQPGDTVLIGPGVYNESLTLKEGVRLEGAGLGKSTVRCDATKAPALTVIGCKTGAIMGLTFEHSGSQVDPTSESNPPLVLAESSAIEILQCAFVNSPGIGLVVKGTGGAVIQHCVAQKSATQGVSIELETGTIRLENNESFDNTRNGMLLQCAPAAQVSVSENTCRGNGNHGIGVAGEGFGPVLTKNQCMENKSCGIYFHTGTQGTAVENLCEENAVGGILVSGQGARPVLSRNQCARNKASGIWVQEGAEPRVEENNCQENEGQGIYVFGTGTRPVLKLNTCTGNKLCGICFEQGSGGIAEENLCERNMYQGVLVQGQGTRPTLTQNQCKSNEGSGIYIADQARADATKNVCAENRGSGIALDKCRSATELVDNECLRNQTYGIWFAEATWVQGHGNNFWQNGQICQGEIGWLLQLEEFEVLEKIAHRLRTDKTRFPSGEWQLGFFYNFLATGRGKVTPSNTEEYMGVMERWRAAFPDSVTARIAQSTAYIALAWKARGSGWAYKVTPEGWKGFYDNLNKAWGVLTEAEKLEQKDPQLYASLVTAAMGLNKDRPNLVGELLGAITGTQPAPTEIEQVFRRGVELEPTYYPLYYARTTSLLPRWGGLPGALEQFAARCADATKKEQGEGMYARIAADALDYVGKDEFLNRMSFSWPRIEQGSKDILAAFPQSSYRRNWLCLFACIYRDRDKARSLFEEVGDNWDCDVWNDWELYVAYRDWASGKTDLQPETTALHQAIDDDDLIEAMRQLEAGADVNARNVQGCTPLYLAVGEENLEAVRLLLEHGADPDLAASQVWTPLHLAVAKKLPEIVRVLLDHGADHSRTRHGGWTPLHVAVNDRSGDIVRMLLEHGADPNLALDNGTTPLRTTQNKDFEDMRALLIEYGGEPKSIYTEESFAALRAARAGDVVTLKKLIEAGANVNEQLPSTGWTALHAAVLQHNIAVLETLLSSKAADVNIQNANGNTPLHEAARHGREAAVKLLLEGNADINVVNNEGKTASALAKERGHEAILQLLQRPSAAE